MMAKIISAKTLVAAHLTKRDRVLLINPPVVETRYSWVRWNQPLDLLKLASYLSTNVRCEVHLLDYMQPDKEGDVPQEWLPKASRYVLMGDEKYPMRRFGRSHSLLKDWLAPRKAKGQSALPTQVWITSLCSYWFESISETCRVVRQELPDAKIVLTGQYARLTPKHAAEHCVCDLVISKTLDLNDQPAALDLYKEPPPFVAVQLGSKSAISDIKAAVKRQIFQVVFFGEDICQDDGEALREIVEATEDRHKHLRYHVICGLQPEHLTPNTAKLLARKSFAQFHFEQASAGAGLNIEAYGRARKYLEEAKLELPDERLSGFVWIGRPGEDLEGIIRNTLAVLDHFGSIILKPFSPTPGEPEQLEHAEYLEGIKPHRWSPHFFPFSDLNGITRTEYHDLYRMAAFLNEKVHNQAFDFLNGTLGAQMLRNSLSREVWNLEPSPLRITD
jgi:hypothetical protein